MDKLGDPPQDMVLDELPRRECLKLLQEQHIGRLAVADHGYYPPHIVPVNYIVTDEDHVVFRSDDGLKFRLSILAEHSVSFEVDSVDDAGHMAWSVVVQGRAELLTGEEADALPLGNWLEPFAPGERQQWIRIAPYAITGRTVHPVPHSPSRAG
jgi:nitroimidazol reductase NimA-like FMN-containing flavoprotein (pyridoxamine 5'-phosphate oxidase superfamily)